MRPVVRFVVLALFAPMLFVWTAGATAGGRAVLCLNLEFELGKATAVTVFPGTVFHNQGPITGDIANKWHVGEAATARASAFITTGEVKLSKAARCAETSVRMYVDGGMNREPTSRAADNDYWAIADSLEYKIGSKPPIEFGRLVDDIAVVGQLRADAGDALLAPRAASDDIETAVRCRSQAKVFASRIGGAVGRTTSAVTFILHPGAPQVSSMSCEFERPSYFVSWSGSARPPRVTLDLIVHAGTILTALTGADVRALVASCIKEALKPDMMATYSTELDGVRAECQAYERDGGGGSVNLWRRFGAQPRLAVQP